MEINRILELRDLTRKHIKWMIEDDLYENYENFKELWEECKDEEEDKIVRDEMTRIINGIDNG